MYDLEDSYWWFQGRLRMIERILSAYMKEEPRKGRVVDVGCGTGLMLKELRRWQPAGIDMSRLAMDFCRQRGIANLMMGNVVELPFQDDSLDLVLALDLIEHIEDDKALVREFHRVLRPGGYLMATVPAHKSLWSDHDIALHHFRRYSYRGFLKLLERNGFEPVKYTFGITFTYHAIVVFRKLQRFWQRSHGVDAPARPRTHLIPLPWFINTPLIKLLHAEAFALRFMDLPFGVSLMTLCRKK